MPVTDKIKNMLDMKSFFGFADTKYQPTSEDVVVPPKRSLKSQTSSYTANETSTESKLTSSSPKLQTESSNDSGPVLEPPKKEIILEWMGSSKMPKGEKNDKLTRAGFIAGIVFLLILLILQEFVVIVAVLVVFFAYHVINSMPDTKLSYRITELGFDYDTIFYPWESFRFFFMYPKGDTVIFCLDTNDALISRLYVFSDLDNYIQVRDAFNEFLPFLEKPPQDFADKIYANVINKFIGPETPSK